MRKVYGIQVSEVILRAEALVENPELAEAHLEKYKPLKQGPAKKNTDHRRPYH
jgi:hypothetical protein